MVKMAQIVEAAGVADLEYFMIAFGQKLRGKTYPFKIDEFDRRHIQILSELPRKMLLRDAGKGYHPGKPGEKIFFLAHIVNKVASQRGIGTGTVSS
jgi:hypothetical protein